ncbi:Uncharacterised protein [[Clostridium] sordellii]|uniref:rolling circle replication-associated protein n=1 Tax=Paraclostridium sordellii TaxID=1505 RepID=UPI0005E3A60F|nr:hypothetical protein [Paeniclostridium sordellii]CEP39603.1 Uncharacterised protein [[Clostridium] sordellii] [Paeniclostridium sordellii]
MSNQIKRIDKRHKSSNKKNNLYTEIDIEKISKRIDEEELSINELQRIIDVTTNSIYEAKTITSGIIREVEIHPVFLKKDIPDELRLKSTKEAKKNLNNKYARLYFIRKANSNFVKGDYYITLSYLKQHLPKDHDEAKKHIRNYFRRLNYLYHKQQIKNGVSKRKCKNIKYMYVTEVSKEGRGRIHHHILMNSVLPMEVVEQTWKHGRRNNIRIIYPDDLHITSLANYLAKDPGGKKRWGCSKKLKEPLITRSVSKFTRKKINQMSNNYNLIEHEMEKVNPKYKFIDASIKKNEFNGKWYITARLKKIKD